jgi:hypothetical protein
MLVGSCKRHIKISILLSFVSANPFKMNDDCHTALDLAREKGHVNVVRAIEVQYLYLRDSSHMCS